MTPTYYYCPYINLSASVPIGLGLVFDKMHGFYIVSRSFANKYCTLPHLPPLVLTGSSIVQFPGIHLSFVDGQVVRKEIFSVYIVAYSM